jgi:DinB superfamily
MCRWRSGRDASTPVEVEMTSHRLPALIDGLAFARNYTVALLDTIPQSDWFKMPPGCPSHVAWQVGHLAIAEARLVLERTCGRNYIEEGLLPAEYLTWFGRLSAADTDPAHGPSPTEIRDAFDQVHSAAMDAIPKLTDNELDDISPGVPHRFCKTKAEFLRWVAHHEMLHTGHIGLIRRMLGQSPMW